MASNTFSAAFVKIPGGWSGAEVDLGDAEIVDDFGDAVTEALGLSGDELALLCVEVEDEWFAIVRYRGDEEPRVFLSDAHAILSDTLGELFAEFAGVAPDKESNGLGVKPAGDFELLSDLGVSSEELLELSMEEGVLPADILSVIAERLSFADELDRLR
ncbi:MULTISPECIES: tRNA adenosine deaminase-associated protein [unclassified Nonomuraea]|uniref:tRNA adenosine deaminase-associated protein n=1 Tax=unclassified Nonomuraea TaxID=2593643 RepID=UPI001BE4957D|nr:tRNA adenosine deaminase-associated protein [Nonomuraea sp. NEAU-A123]MBT2226305.1 tRNA adenosine deaminase-associated protein [Nonomuraea sp. NEAU-A123]